MPRLFHCDDCRGKHDWPFVYLHGNAEIHSGKSYSELSGEACHDRRADDIFCCDSPMPTEPGECSVELYGRQAIAVIDYAGRNFLCGRVALIDDEAALAHCRIPHDWR